MKIKEVTYSNKYVTGPYLNHQPGFVADVGENEDPIEALMKLKAIADEFDRRVNNFEERLVSEMQPERFNVFSGSQTDEEIEITRQFEKAKADLAAIQFQEDAMLYVKNNGWSLNPDIKNIANSKPKKQ